MSEEAGSSSKVINQVCNLHMLDWPTRVLRWVTKEFYLSFRQGIVNYQIMYRKWQLDVFISTVL